MPLSYAEWITYIEKLNGQLKASCQSEYYEVTSLVDRFCVVLSSPFDT